MTADEVADTLAVMALVAIAIAAAGVVLWVIPATRDRLRAVVDSYACATAAIMATVATAGSLWFSEGAHFPPCQLCWYQRIAMYPLVVILGLRAIRGGDNSLRTVGLVLVGAGIAVNAWHVAIETHPAWDTGSCQATVPCTVRWVEGLGFFTIPRLATVAFWSIGAMLLADRTDRRRPMAEIDR